MRRNRWMKLNYFPIFRIHNGLSQLGEILSHKVLMLNMCSPPPQIFFNTLRKSICYMTAAYGNMLFSKCCNSDSNSSPLSIWKPDAFAFCNCSCYLCSSVKKNQVWTNQLMNINILLLPHSLSWHRKGFGPRCIWKSNWGINLWNQQDQQFGHRGCQDAEGWDLSLNTHYTKALYIVFDVVHVGFRWSHSQRA